MEDTFQTIFFGPEEDRFYHESGSDMGYLEDTGNYDARTEGMSYGMMMCVQMDRKDLFDRIWKWAKTYMYQTSGPEAGYFAWSCAPDGRKNAEGAAPDGEEYFAMALFFASHRWGDGEGIFNYSAEARQILHDCVHKGEQPGTGSAMWDPENHLIRFVAGCDFSDPSYHLPHFYDLFSLWANEEDRPFWKRAARASREYLHLACHGETGLSAEYAAFDGTAAEDAARTFTADGTTGSTATPTARRQTSAWTGPGLRRTNGSAATRRASSASSAKSRAAARTACSSLTARPSRA